MASNKAAFLDGVGARLSVRDAPMPTAAAGRVVIKNKAVAVNPVDWKVQDYGAFVKSWPFVVGEDFAGEIVEVGEGVKHLKKGDRVTA
jgi:NADPH:quinone reductase-like Zn-dependent oxidoreductase